MGRPANLSATGSCRSIPNNECKMSAHSPSPIASKSAPTARSSLPSYIPRPIQSSSKAPTTSQKGYLKGTAASRQRQRESVRSASKNKLSTAFANQTAKHAAKEGFVSRIPILSKTRARTALPGGPTPCKSHLLPSLCVQTSYQAPSSPPPEYTEGPEPAEPFYTAKLALPSSDLPSEPSPLYRKYASDIGDYELFDCPYPEEDLEECEAVAPGSLSESPVGDNSYGSEPGSSQSWSNRCTYSSIYGLNMNPNIDELSRGALGDIFKAFDSIPLAQDAAVRAYQNDSDISSLVCGPFGDVALVNTSYGSFSYNLYV